MKKKAILEEYFNSGLSLSAISSKHQIHPVTLYSWKRSLCMSDKDEN
ncbi:MAG: transposase [Silvanigrellaceae bacterium]|nr:transposase [Silvanigrellaceae bacterium]